MKDGILLIDKPSGLTSRDVVNVVCKKLNTKKVGHTGTLDPFATGLMVICVNKATKLVELLSGHDKSYVVGVKMGIMTDTLDITGEIINQNNNFQVSKEQLIDVLHSFVGCYEQEVPLYSAVKVNGRKLYEYARAKIAVELPRHMVEIKRIELLSFNNDEFSFQVLVSKGTYIRSLVRDISHRLNILMTVSSLRRITVDHFKVLDAKKMADISLNDLLSITEAVNLPIIKVEGVLAKKISNGAIIEQNYHSDMVLFTDMANNPLAIYKQYDDIMRSYRVF